MSARAIDVLNGSPRQEDVSSTLLECDLVMKGGITSGVVYPKAVVRIARDYRIRNVGGTSVGAIAAALTTAAEYYRQTNPKADAAQWDDLRAKMDHDLQPSAINADAPEHEGHVDVDAPGFSGLWAIPREIGRDLQGKFQPQRRTSGLFRYLTLIMAYKTFAGKLVRALVDGFYVFRTVAAVFFAVMAIAFARDPEIAAGFALLPLIALVLLLVVGFARRYVDLPLEGQRRLSPGSMGVIAVVFCLALFAVALILRALLGLPSSGFTVGDYLFPFPQLFDQLGTMWDNARQAFTEGLDAGERTETRFELFGIVAIGAISGWFVGGILAVLYYLLVAIRFNHLGLCTGLGDAAALTNWLTRKINVVAGLGGDDTVKPLTMGQLAEHRIEFKAITSDLTRGVPLDLPAALKNYQFQPKQFSDFFTPAVLEQLGVQPGQEQSTELQPFPHWKDIPVIVVARMSMSFPVLFSAVPVHHRDANDEVHRCWLSDGGIVSNFPVHMFDRALSPFPTFAFDLIEKDSPEPDADPEKQVSINPIRANGVPADISPATIDPARRPKIKMRDLGGLLAGILNTARGWMDNSQKTLPGYAERIVAIHLYPGEGGMNLNMEATIIERLARRGLFGAHTLLRDWCSVDGAGQRRAGNQWHQHRWLRYRILMRELEELGREWKQVYTRTDSSPQGVHTPSMAELVASAGTADDLTRDLCYQWLNRDAACTAGELTNRFDAFAPISNQPDEPLSFDQATKPTPNPKLFMIPPFE